MTGFVCRLPRIEDGVDARCRLHDGGPFELALHRVDLEADDEQAAPVLRQAVVATVQDGHVHLVPEFLERGDNATWDVFEFPLREPSDVLEGAS